MGEKKKTKEIIAIWLYVFLDEVMGEFYTLANPYLFAEVAEQLDRMIDAKN